MNLLDLFVLQHVQVSLLKAELVHASKEAGTQEAKVELNLTPRLMQADSGDSLPAYQVSAKLTCNGGSEDGSGPMFNAKVGFEAIYQQVEGKPVDVAEFTSNHGVQPGSMEGGASHEPIAAATAGVNCLAALVYRCGLSMRLRPHHAGRV